MRQTRVIVCRDGKRFYDADADPRQAILYDSPLKLRPTLLLLRLRHRPEHRLLRHSDHQPSLLVVQVALVEAPPSSRRERPHLMQHPAIGVEPIAREPRGKVESRYEGAAGAEKAEVDEREDGKSRVEGPKGETGPRRGTGDVESVGGVQSRDGGVGEVGSRAVPHSRQPLGGRGAKRLDIANLLMAERRLTEHRVLRRPGLDELDSRCEGAVERRLDFRRDFSRLCATGDVGFEDEMVGRLAPIAEGLGRVPECRDLVIVVAGG